jgi:hypothetical protein
MGSGSELAFKRIEREADMVDAIVRLLRQAREKV